MGRVWSAKARFGLSSLRLALSDFLKGFPAVCRSEKARGKGDRFVLLNFMLFGDASSEVGLVW